MFNEYNLYAICIITGFILGFILLRYRLKDVFETNKERLMYYLILICCTLFFVIGALFFDSLFHGLNGEGFKVHGITFLGGLVTGLSAFVILYLIYFPSKRNKIYNHLNILAPSLALGHMFGRIGCFCAGCCFGKETNSFIGVIFPKGSIPAGEFGYGVKVIPIQLIEALCLLIIFLIIIRIKKQQFAVYLVTYGIARFIIEFFRGDNRGYLLNFLSPAQGLSIILIIAGLFVFIKNRKIEI